MLTSEQARKNQERYGYNELAEGKKKSVLQIFLEQFKDFLVIILIIAAVVSGFLGDAESAAVIFVVITMNAVLGTVQTVKAEQSLNGLKKLSAPAAKVVRDGTLVQIPAREVTIGDEVVIEAGDCIPADGQLFSCASLKTDESALTGECLPVEKSLEDVPADAAIGDQTNRVFSGSFVTYGRGTCVVTAIGMETEVGRIARLIKTASEKRTPLQVSLDEFGKKLSVIILVFCGLLFGMNILRGGSAVDAFLFAVALAVAAIPEALSSIVTIVLSFGTQKMAKEHAIVRKLQAVEGLGSVSVICSDKTGTLTQNKMTAEYYYVDGRRIPAEEIDLNSRSQELLLRFSILCNDSTNEDGAEIGDPTETALINLAQQLGVNVAEVRRRYPRLSELPFDSDRKRMSTVHRMRLPEDDGKEQTDINCKRNVAVVKGAVDMLLDRMAGITQEDRDEIERQNLEFSRDGLRVLAFAYKELDGEREISLEDEEDLTFLGLIAMMDPPREESKEAVGRCIQAGIKPVMITGDHKVTAAAIAKRIGILKDDSEACEGAVIENMTDQELQEFVEGISVYARVSPEHKIRIVRAWQDKGNIVAMTGDGVNDAPALKQADIGFAMGDGTAVAQEAGDVVILNNSLTSIKDCVLNSRTMAKSVGKFLIFQLTVNISTLLMNIIAPILGWTEPFSIVQILWINLIMDTLAAMAFGGEPILQRYMDDKPAKRTDNILTGFIKSAIGVSSVFITLGSILILEDIGGITEFVMPASCTDPELYEKTFMFAFFIYAIIFNSLNTRSDRFNLFEHIGENKRFLLVMGSIFVLQTVIIQIGGEVFSTTMLSWQALLVAMALGFLVIPVDLVRKAFVRR